MKTIAFYTSKVGFGYRENSYDWKVGERILSKDGMTRQTIVKVMDATPWNIEFARKLMEKVNRYAGSGRTTTKVVFENGGIGVYSKTQVWKDGTGLSYFLRCLNVSEN